MKVDEGEFPWIIQESLSGVELSNDLKKTLDLLRTYAKDLKFTKSSILTLPHAPQFPNSEWTNVIIRAMVDLDHVISEVLLSPMTTGMSKLLERSNSSLVPPEQAKCQETGSSHEICTQKLPHLLSLTDSMNYRLTGNTSLGFSLPSQSETTLTFSCLTRLCKSKLENDATSFSQILWNLTTYASTGST